jgi:cytochrome c-type biogenesis protein CcmE
MTRKQRRLGFVLAGVVVLGAATGLVLSAFEDSIVFFYSPTDLATKVVPKDRRIRIGGLVEGESVEKLEGGTIAFTITDTAHSVPVRFTGILPDLFREGQGVVAQGTFGEDKVFNADEVLAKHDETYMPPEVAESLKKAGVWKGQQGPAGAKPAAEGAPR